MISLQEATRNELIRKSTSSAKGRERYNKRKRSRIASSVKEYNSIDMNKLFKDDILDLKVKVQGETDNYEVRVSFSGFIENVQKLLQRSNTETVDLRIITRALQQSLNSENVYVHCSCDDFRFRYDFWSSVNKYNSGPLQTSNGMEIRNPDDSLGAACKHCLLVLSNANWFVKVSSTINNYIKYIKNHYQKQYAEIIYPALFGKEYEEPVQTSIFDTDELASDVSDIDNSNEEGRTRGQFKPGNTQGVRFVSNRNNNINQVAMNLNQTDENEE